MRAGEIAKEAEELNVSIVSVRYALNLDISQGPFLDLQGLNCTFRSVDVAAHLYVPGCKHTSTLDIVNNLYNLSKGQGKLADGASGVL
jgi:hypothetical protein